MLDFVSHDQGFLDHMDGTKNFKTGNVAAVLVTENNTPNRTSQTQFSHISANACGDAGYAHIAVSGKAITLSSTKIRFTCSKITFTASGSFSGQYIYFVFGNAASLSSSDRIFGHIDLTGNGDASSVNAEFSFTPHANGLFEIPRPSL